VQTKHISTASSSISTVGLGNFDQNYSSFVSGIFFGLGACSDVNKDTTHKAKDKAKATVHKAKDKAKDTTHKDKDKAKDLYYLNKDT